MVAPGAGFRGGTLSRSRNSEDPKKNDVRRKSSGFSFQKQINTKKEKKGLCSKITGFSVEMRLDTRQIQKTRFSPQLSGVVVLHHNMVSLQMVSPQNGITQGGLPPPATPLVQ